MFDLSVEAALFPELASLAGNSNAPVRIVPYIGTKRKLLSWIREQIPDDVHHVVDAFAGGCSVAYMLKTEGFQVTTNDSLRWSWHVSRAVVVNQRTQVTDEEIEALLEPNAEAGSFVQDTYAGKFWREGVHQAIDEVRENIDALKGFKRDIALAALGAAMLLAKGWFQHFTTQTVSPTGDTPAEFRARVGATIRRLNQLVMEGEACVAKNRDVLAFLPTVQADLVYLDPPYVTPASSHNYSEDYHAIEAVMVKGRGRHPDPDSANAREKTQADQTPESIAPFLQAILEKALHIPACMLSYRDQAIPSEAELEEILEAAGRQTSKVETEHTYTLAGPKRDGDYSKAREILFLGRVKPASETPEDAAVKRQQDAAAAAEARAALIATLDVGRLVAVAEDAKEGGEDHEIAFVLCHAGTNRNGDHFTVDELTKAAASAAGVKINLKHGQKAQDIVGKTESAAFEDVDGGRVVCGGKLFTGSDELAAKARKLIHEDLITKVSMECSYQKGECSVCGHTFTDAADRCEHLKKQKGQKVDGEDCFEILHGVTFTGAGLLEGYEPADPKADITSMAHGEGGRLRAESYYGDVGARPESVKQVLIQQEIRDDLWRTQDAFGMVVNTLVGEFTAGKISIDDTSTKIRQAATDTADRVIQILTSISKETGDMKDAKTQAATDKPLKDMTQAELLQHAEQLMAQNQELAGKVQAAEDEKAKQAAKDAAEALVALMEKKGRTFEGAAARQAEVERLAGLSDEARQAVEDTWKGMADAQAKEPNEEEKAAAAAAGGASASAAATSTLRVNASLTPPTGADPAPVGMTQKLGDGLAALHQQRLARERGEATE